MYCVRASQADLTPENCTRYNIVIGGPYRIARQLGITEHRLDYLLKRKWLRQHEKQIRVAEKKAKETPGNIFVSNLLGFSIWLPDGWQVTSEHSDVEDMSQGIEKWYAQWCKYTRKEKLKIAYQSFAERYPLAGVSFKEFCQGADERIAEEEQWLQAELRFKEKQGLQVGYWGAEPRNQAEEDPLSVEVIRFRFREPMTSLELYYAEKPGEKNVHTVSRPVSRRDLLVDGMQVVKAYYYWRDHWYGKRREPGNAQCAAYLTEGLIGWTNDFWTKQEDAYSLRPLFHRIISSFHRT